MSNPHRNNSNPNLPYQAGQMNGDDVTIVPTKYDGDTNIFGNWTWESQNAVDSLRKIQHVTDIDDTVYSSIPNFREVHRSSYGAVATCAQVPVVLGFAGFNVWTSGWSQVNNYINTNSFDVGAALTVVKAGVYRYVYSGSVFVSAGAGVLTQVSAAYRIGAGTYSVQGGLSTVVSSAAGMTSAPYALDTIITLNANDVIRPAYFINTSAVITVNANSVTLMIEPLYFT